MGVAKTRTEDIGMTKKRPLLTKRAPNAEASARSEAKSQGHGRAKSSLGMLPNPQPGDAAAREMSRSIESSKTRRSC